MRLEGKSLSFSYEKKYILNNLHLEIKSALLTSITGPNGVGKSTLLKCLSNISSLQKGVVYLDGRAINNIKSSELARTLAYVPQKEASSFSITVYEMILLGRRPYIKWRVQDSDKKLVNNIISKLKIEHLADRDVNTLSGGERQKIAIARALAQEPEILFLDEPTANLDINHQLEVMKILQKLTRSEMTTVVTVLHDINLASRYSDRIFLMEPGGIFTIGTPDKVFTSERLKKIYNIDVEIIKTSSGNHIIPIDAGDNN